MRFILFLSLILAAACARGGTSKLGGTSVTCPLIAPPGSPYPKMSYTTFILDGKVIGVRRAQRNFDSHSAEVIDTIPAVERLEERRIKSLRFLPADSARLYEPCPGVAVLAIESERRWWWPW